MCGFAFAAQSRLMRSAHRQHKSTARVRGGRRHVEAAQRRGRGNSGVCANHSSGGRVASCSTLLSEGVEDHVAAVCYCRTHSCCRDLVKQAAALSAKVRSTGLAAVVTVRTFNCYPPPAVPFPPPQWVDPVHARLGGICWLISSEAPARVCVNRGNRVAVLPKPLPAGAVNAVKCRTTCSACVPDGPPCVVCGCAHHGVRRRVHECLPGVGHAVQPQRCLS
jgi:hypothetical protein